MSQDPNPGTRDALTVAAEPVQAGRDGALANTPTGTTWSFPSADNPRRCVATAHNGSRCRHWAVRNGTHCAAHIMRDSEAIIEAHVTLKQMASLAVRAVRDVLEDPLASEADRLQAARLVFDRIGLGPGMSINQMATNPLDAMSNEELFADAARFAEELVTLEVEMQASRDAKAAKVPTP